MKQILHLNPVFEDTPHKQLHHVAYGCIEWLEHIILCKLSNFLVSGSINWRNYEPRRQLVADLWIHHDEAKTSDPSSAQHW